MLKIDKNWTIIGEERLVYSMCVCICLWQKAYGNGYIYDQPERRRSTLNTVHYTKSYTFIFLYNKKIKDCQKHFVCERRVAYFFDIQIADEAITLLNESTHFIEGFILTLNGCGNGGNLCRHIYQFFRLKTIVEMFFF